jgi:hypothetical protein
MNRQGYTGLESDLAESKNLNVRLSREDPKELEGIIDRASTLLTIGAGPIGGGLKLAALGVGLDASKLTVGTDDGKWAVGKGVDLILERSYTLAGGRIAKYWGATSEFVKAALVDRYWSAAVTNSPSGSGLGKCQQCSLPAP